MDDILDITWVCPRCLTTNLDNYELTADPVCDKCDHTPGWEHILAPSQQQDLNRVLAERTKDQ